MAPLYDLVQRYRDAQSAYHKKYGSTIDAFLRVYAAGKGGAEAYKAMLPDYVPPCLSPTLARIAE